MNATTAIAEQSPEAKFRAQFERLGPEIGTALPPHVPLERFMRVVLTAVNGNPALIDADRRSLFEAAMKAAQDGLLPDGRDGALVIFNTKVKVDGKDVTIAKVQWLVMVGGLLKKVRNSGELKEITSHVVYERDEFNYVLGDDEKITHKPYTGPEEPGSVIMVYAIAKTKDEGIYREVMTVRQVERVRAVSRAKDGPAWKNWWDEMARKTVIRRLSKRLPTSADLDDLIRRDDELYDFNARNAELADDKEKLFKRVRSPLNDDDLLDRDRNTAGATIDGETGEITEDRDDSPEAEAQRAAARAAREADDARDRARLAADEANRVAAEAAAKAKPKADVDPYTGEPLLPARVEPTRTNHVVAEDKPAANSNGPGPAPRYTDGASYVTHMMNLFEYSTSETAVKDEWGATRQFRADNCSPAQMEALKGKFNETINKLRGS